MVAVEQIRLLEPMIIPACGAKKAGTIVTPEECGESWEWILNHGRFEVVSTDVPVAEPEVDAPPELEVVVDAVVEPEVDATEVVQPVEPEAVVEPTEVVEPPVVEPQVVEPETVVAETEPVVTSEESQALEAIKAVLSVGKGRLADVVEKSGLTEEVVSALLTEANGFYKNQQGWYGTVK